MTAIVMCSCASKSDIEKACNQGDFEKAYRLAEESGYGRSIVAKKECMYILENMGEEGIAKVAIIASDQYIHIDPNDLIKYAISLKNESMAIKLYKMYAMRLQTEDSRECVEYAMAVDMEDFITLVISTTPEFIENTTIVDYLKGKGKYDEIVVSLLQKSYDSLLNKEISGKRPPLGLQDYSFGSELLENHNYHLWAPEKYNIYYHSLLEYNADCLNLLEKAIALKQLEMAKKIVLLVKQSIKITLGDSDKKIYVNKQRVDGSHSYIQSDDTDIKNAKKRLADAIREGAFN